MKYLLDTADKRSIDKYKLFIEGITTNPTILKRCHTTPQEFLNECVDIHLMKFIQIHSMFQVIDNSDIIYKIPLIDKGYELISSLVCNGIRVCGTITYDVIQFHQACELGCEFCIVLIDKNTNTKFLDECVKIKNNYNYDIKIIAASFRNKIQVEEAILSGADYATISPNIMDEMFTNDIVNMDYNQYKKDM